MNRQGLSAAIAAIAAGLAVVGCGGQGSAQLAVPGGGKGIGAGLRAAGLSPCVGPLGGDGGALLTLYAQHGFAALVASGQGAEEHAIDLALIRNHVQSAPPAAEIAATERSWHREALNALSSAKITSGPCRSEVRRMPVLAPTEVVCSNELLVPLGRPAAMGRFVHVLSMLLGVHVTPAQVRYVSGGPYSTGHYYTTPATVDTQRPYCGNG